jgi:hypothetical protein
MAFWQWDHSDKFFLLRFIPRITNVSLLESQLRFEFLTQLADTGKQASSNLLSVVEIAQRKKSVSTSLRRATDVNAKKTTVGDCSRDITIPMNIASEEQTHGIFGTIRRLTWQLLARVSSTAPDTSGHCEGREEGSRPIRATKSPPFDSYQEYIMPKECT